MRSRRVIVTLLVYVALDLSIAEMPGAFVFDAEASVVGTAQGARSQLPAAFAMPLRPMCLFPAVTQTGPERLIGRIVCRIDAVPGPTTPARLLPRSVCSPPPPEDPY